MKLIMYRLRPRNPKSAKIKMLEGIRKTVNVRFILTNRFENNFHLSCFASMPTSWLPLIIMRKFQNFEGSEVPVVVHTRG